MRVSGSSTRRIGRLRSEASPSKSAVIPWPPTTPIINLVPVPALPKSSGARGSRSAPMPTPSTCQAPSPRRSIRAPKARQAAPVCRTSSPSSRPSISVRPTLKSPRMKARCEMDLSPGGLKRPLSGPPGAALAAGDGGGTRVETAKIPPDRANPFSAGNMWLGEKSWVNLSCSHTEIP